MCFLPLLLLPIIDSTTRRSRSDISIGPGRNMITAGGTEKSWNALPPSERERGVSFPTSAFVVVSSKQRKLCGLARVRPCPSKMMLR